jgi:hypothetical protein
MPQVKERPTAKDRNQSPLTTGMGAKLPCHEPLPTSPYQLPPQQ